MSARPRLGIRSGARHLLLTLLVAVTSAGALAASASPADTRALVYRCTLSSTDEGDDIRLTFRLRTNEARREWRVRLFREGERVYSRVRTTNAAGDLKVVRTVDDLPGPDDVRARARELDRWTICEVESRI